MKAAISQAAPSSRLAIIDTVRTVSISIVILGHTMGVIVLTSGPFAWLFNRIAANSTYGVTIFFVVSGFIITHTLSERYKDLSKVSFSYFYVRRIARLLPLATFVLITGAIIGLLTHPDAARNFVLRTPRARFNLAFMLSFPLLIFN